MSKKNKGINEDTQILTIPCLMRRCDEELSKRMAERKKKEEANKASLIEAAQKERGIIDEIDKAKNIVKKMVTDYQEIELKVIAEKRKEAEGTALREADVKSGKAKLKDFHLRGKRDSVIAEETRQKSIIELEQTCDVIREKKLEILMLEDSLGECRNRIRGLAIQPGVFMIDLLKGLREFTENEVGAFMGELESLRFSWNQTKEKMHVTQGRSMSGRYSWNGLTMGEARGLCFSPLLPRECIPKLKKILEEYEGADGISLTLYLTKPPDVEITSIIPRRGFVQTSQIKIKEAQDGRIKKIK